MVVQTPRMISEYSTMTLAVLTHYCCTNDITIIYYLQSHAA